MATNDRLEISRLVHRFGFGPKPGEFAALNSLGLKAARSTLLSVPEQDVGLASVSNPVLSDLGPFPPQKSTAAATFEANRSAQILSLQLWWLDRMASADNALTERMTWFWHGHWATAVGKVEYALPMFIQNQLLRISSLGNFRNQARSMIVDSALLYWLDGESNIAGSPNENLAREFMELFTLGVGAYSETDVQTLARALTGYNTDRSAGTVSFNPKKHDSGTLTFLGTVGTFDAPAASDFITTLSANQSFIPKRIWYRFISSTDTLLDTDTVSVFSNREILPLVTKIATHSAMSDPRNSQAKSPVEWFVGVCRALEILPSALPHNANVIRYLTAMGQVPFDPPNVGGWPTDEAWLNISSMQSRMAFSKYILSQVDLSKINALPQSDVRIQYLADLFGVAEWSSRTKSVFRTSLDNPQELVLIAINAPDYVVNA
jgi:uncharacterized protein (DUF1800 family)